jgi:NAD(P)-dependent dehydrogenase (short-subunit alcohol dehydrogenase family)
MDLNLRGRRALIAGSSKGIGLAIARSLAAEGCHVQLVARTRADLDRAVAQIKSDFGVEATAHAADLSAGANVKALAATAGDVDILVNSAGAVPRGTLLEIDEERWRKSWDLKVFGAINLTREIYRGMCERKRGVVINVAGMAGERPDAYYIAGSMANAALIMFSRSLGGDSIRYGVRVLVVNPGPVETELHLNNTKRLAKERLGDENRWREIMHRVPMKRAATVEEVADMVAFLASDRCSYISGSSILIDGGLLTDSSIGVNRA